MDRGTRNCFLPVFFKLNEEEDDDNESDEDHFTQNPSAIMRTAINDFIRRAFEGKANSDLLLPLRSFVAIVSLLEVRLRRRPDVLDSPTVPILLQNLLLTIYHGLHKGVVKNDLSKECKSNALLRLIYFFIKSNDPRTEFHSNVTQIAQSMKKNSSHLHEFLRRAAIIEDIALNKNSSSKLKQFIDWDDVLSIKNLIERFDVKSSEENAFKKLKKFKGIKLPKKFISLYWPPFNIDICDSSIIKALDLITGQVVVYPQNRNEYANKDYKTIYDAQKEVYKGGLAMYLVLTKESASSILFCSKAVGKLWVKDSFYVDKFGDTDHGFKRGLITKLSKDKLENAIDKLLSSDIILY